MEQRQSCQALSALKVGEAKTGGCGSVRPRAGVVAAEVSRRRFCCGEKSAAFSRTQLRNAAKPPSIPLKLNRYSGEKTSRPAQILRCSITGSAGAACPPKTPALLTPDGPSRLGSNRSAAVTHFTHAHDISADPQRPFQVCIHEAKPTNASCFQPFAIATQAGYPYNTRPVPYDHTPKTADPVTLACPCRNGEWRGACRAFLS